jgi:hypothetical protein
MSWATGVQNPAGTRVFCVLHSVQTVSGAHSGSYSMGTAFSLGVKRLRGDDDHSSPSVAEGKNGGAIPSPPYTPS